MFLLLYLLALFPLIHGMVRIDPLVSTKQGLIRGLRSENGLYSMFLGIPYAVVDKANPFGPSSPHPIFEDTFQAYDDSVVCPQVTKKVPVGSIECLHLNIYVPNVATTQNRLPVMFWIHGGGFTEGSGNRELYSPEFIVRHDIIVVSINYRLGPYGFLCLDIPEVSGNQGIKDQVLALKWVNENIEYFGGDANKITLFGESAGGRSVQLHLLSKYEKLYDKIIIQSSASLSLSRVTEPDNAVSLKISEYLGFETESLQDSLSFLTNQSPLLIVAAAEELGIVALICNEKEYSGVENLITDYPHNINSTKVRDMPVLIGINSNEMLSRYGNFEPEFFENYSFKNALTGFDLFDSDVVDIVRHFYIGDEFPNESLKQNIIDFESDLSFNHAAERAVKKYINDEAHAVYYYVFTYDGGRNLFKIDRNLTGPGATHGDELGYLFGSEIFHDQPSDQDQLVIDRITTLWTNFAKYGEPTPVSTDLLSVKWEPVTDTVQNYLEIDSELKLLRRPFKERMAFWDLFYKIKGNEIF